MGEHRNAARALAHMPRWVAVHEDTLAQVEAVIASVGPLSAADDTLRRLNEGRRERDRAISVAMDEPEEDETRPMTEWGAWVAYYSDMSDVVVFATELEALRYAVAHSMEVVWVRSGQALDEARAAGRAERSTDD